MATARDIALKTLLQWTVPNEPPFLPEREDADWKALAARDRAFAFDLLTGVLRWRGTLDAVIASRLRQPLESLDHPVRALLWLGTYQVLFQAGTADYAAVDTTVAMAKKHSATAKASGLINAILRNVTRLNPTTVPRDAAAPFSRRAFAVDFESQVVLNADIFPPPSDLAAHLACVRSHPVPFVNRLLEIYGESRAGELLLRNNLRPTITLRADADALDVPAAAGLAAHAEAARFVVAAEGWNPIIEGLVHKGALSPQDPTAAKPVRRLGELVGTAQIAKPARVLDFCAGLGTKSLQLARAFPNAAVVATDVDGAKLERLERRAKAVGQANISVRAITELLAQGSPDRFDWVLVDVPCSNTGVMAKRVQSRWRWPRLDHAALRALQMRLLGQGASLLAPGGVLVYSTCSLDPAENEELVAAFMERPPTPLRLIMQEGTLPSLTSRADATRDGGYFAAMVMR